MEEPRIIEAKAIVHEYVAAIDNLLTQLTPDSPPFTESHLSSIISSPDSHLFLLICGWKIIGMMTIAVYNSPTGRKAWIEDVVVDKAYRGKSLGRKLIAYAVNYVREMGDCVLMLTSNSSRKAANRLYQSTGFEQKPTNVYRMKLYKS